MNEITMIPLNQLYPHPDNPRQAVGDISELAESIKANGVMQNLTVTEGHYMDASERRSMEESYEAEPTPEIKACLDSGMVPIGYTVLIGHRRTAAARRAGLTEVPCVIVKMDHAQQVTTMLVENMQRSDLTVYEQAQGFQMMLDLGESVQSIVKKSGFSETTVRRRLKLAELDQEKLKEVSGRQISIGSFDELGKVENIDERNKLLKDIGTPNFAASVAAALAAQKREKNLPLIKEECQRIGLTELSESEAWSSTWEQLDRVVVQNYQPEKGLTVKEGVTHYYVTAWGEVRLYRKRKAKPAEKKSPEKIALEEAIKKQNAMLEEVSARAYQLRRDFVSKLPPENYKNRKKYFMGLLRGVIVHGLNYDLMDFDDVCEFFGVNEDASFDDKRENVMEKISSITPEQVPGLVYMIYQDGEEETYYEEGHMWNMSFPKWKENWTLDALYIWLESLGYEMSDEERQLQEGTHPLFKEAGKQ